MRSALVLTCVFVVACAAAPPPPQTAALPPVATAPPPTRYGIDPPVPRDHGDLSLPVASPQTPEPSWGCGESSAMSRLTGLHSKMRRCYETSLATHPDRSGKATFKLTIDAAGQATAVTVASSTMNDPWLEHCLADTLKSAHYPCVAGEITVPLTLAHP